MADSVVIIYASPAADEILGGGAMVCMGDTGVVYYIEGLTNSTFDWRVENGNIRSESGDSISVDWEVPPGDYIVAVIEVSENGCAGDTLKRSIRVEGPALDLGDETYICEGEVYSIDLSGEYTTYLWSDGSTGSGFSADSEGWIGLQVGDEYGCTATDSLYLTVQALPVVDLGIDTSLCGDIGLILDAGNDGTSYIWSTGDNGQQITIFQGGRRIISVIVEDEFGCVSMDTIVVDECNVEFFFRDMPTAITPNGDGTNDVWNIAELAGYSRAEVEIFSRWGTLVWKSEPGYSEPWDGRDMRGKLVPMDSYHFVIKLNVGSVDRITGIITVIR
jgi:gliding motility-associated-like protein